MNTIKFIALLLILAVPGFSKAPADDNDIAPTKALLTSGPWRISGRTWSWIRRFNADGTFSTDNYGVDHGTWEITADKIVLTFADGHTDTLLLPLNPRSTQGTDRSGNPTVAFAIDDPPAVPAQTNLATLRREYIASLNDLLRYYTGKNRRRKAKAVADELNKVSPGLIAPDAPPVGTWLWDQRSMLVTLHADGTVTKNNTAENKKSKDHWHWTDKAAGKFEIDWQAGWIDKSTLGADGKTFTVLNNAGDEYTVQYVPQTAPAGDARNGEADDKTSGAADGELEDGGR